MRRMRNLQNDIDTVTKCLLWIIFAEAVILAGGTVILWVVG